MLDQLIESRTDARNSKRGGFLLTSLILVTSLFLSGLLWSMFAKDLGMGSEDLELSTLVMPVPIAAEAPEPPEPAKQESAVNNRSDLPTRRDNIMRPDEVSKVPDTISTTPMTGKARPMGDFVIKNGPEVEGPSSGSQPAREISGGSGNGLQPGSSEPETTEKAPEIKRKKAEPEVKKPTGPIRVSVLLNSQATSLPKPAYPAPAIAMHVEGSVSVQITIDEAGNVISSKAVSGHPLLTAAAENAARSAKFTPTKLNDVPVKVTGIIVYKFSR